MPDDPVPIRGRETILNATYIVDQVKESGSLEIHLSDQTLLGTLERHSLLNTSVHKSHTAQGPVVHSQLDNEFFSGSLEGEGTFAQMMTASWGFSMAYKYNGSWYHLAAANRSQEASGSMVYTSTSMKLDGDGGGDSSSSTDSWPCRDVGHHAHVATDHDFEFSKVDNHGERSTEIFNMIASVWHCDLGTDFIIEDVTGWHTDSDVLTSYDSGTLLHQLQDYWENTDHHNTGDSAEREFVHLLTGRNLTNNDAGNAYLGLETNDRGCCYPDSEYAYSLHQCDYGFFLPDSDDDSWISENDPCQRDETDHFNKIIGAHEIGHQFSGVHEAADNVCDDDDDCSIMHDEYRKGIRPFYSGVNEERILAWHEENERHNHHDDSCPCLE